MDLLRSVSHPDEILALVRYKLGDCRAVLPQCDPELMSPTLRKCYDYLRLTSRSFAAVIQALDDELRDSVCIFYLVLRALDTVEDDMTIPNKVKLPILRSFYKNLLDPKWCYTESKEKDRIVLDDFPTISYEFRQLSAVSREVISDICRQMGEGMCVYMERNVETLADWDEYCHYVAGLIGIGLSKLFSASGLEGEFVGKDLDLANRMGLFLQRTNIIRDYLEDSEEGREFWPKQVWSKYAKNLRDFAHPHHRGEAVNCLNDLITRTLELIPDCIKYMSRLQNKSVFQFCAIPQVMAIATLERCYSNPSVFTGVVKIRKGEAVKMIMGSSSTEKVKAIMVHYTNEIAGRIPAKDPNAEKTRKLCEDVLACCKTKHEYTTSSIYPPLYVSCAMMLVAISYNYWSQIEAVYHSMT
ncbi:squalene synthase-like isoform X1 [Haliotis rubra]|uniref:squalene synthase-like isoform X1 n=2 Tax=Haliotis rubra TaxID=36100 RepID=UPI001EE5CA0D|nr:squalene synthase-like isoform X1 [Haliotis rubra]XP_046547405.1 squalene synthase-like isoform X1 [Haliotis rubra]XP_046547406.1 squalene synthase-like isoform X1 [Haliotis rubra]